MRVVLYDRARLGYVGLTTFRRNRQVGAVYRFCKRRMPAQYDIALSEANAKRTMEADADQKCMQTLHAYTTKRCSC